MYVGLRQYTTMERGTGSSSNPYPTQPLLKRDTFVAILGATNNNEGGTGRLKVTNQPETFSTGADPNTFFIGDYINEYGQFGHAFCGFYAFTSRNPSEPILTSIIIEDSNAEAVKPSNN